MSRYQVNDVFAGRYRLVKHLGMGGFSQVWKSEDQMAEGLVQAVKIFAPDRGLDENGILLFRKEYALTASLNHPHLLKATHFDIHKGSPYLIMPYCEYGSLYGNIVNEHIFDERALAQALLQISDGLAYLHAQGILHQDIKPDNVFIRQPSHYVLADFGISTKMRRTVVRSMMAEDAARHSAFTPAYAPPEKHTSKPTPAGDVFSLGVTLYELLTHDVPFEDVGLALNKGATVPDLPDAYSPGLNALLQQCMALETTERPTADELRDAARNYLDTGTWPTTAEASSEPSPPPGKRVTQPMPKEEVAEPAPPRPPKAKAAVSKEPPPTQRRRVMMSAFAIVIVSIALIVWVMEQIPNADPSPNSAVQNPPPDTTQTPQDSRVSDLDPREVPQIPTETQPPYRTNTIGMAFAEIRSGTFEMGDHTGNGSPNERPVHSVTLTNNFYIGRHEVTQGQYAAVMGTNPSSNTGDDNRPVELVSWYDAVRFANALSRLEGLMPCYDNEGNVTGGVGGNPYTCAGYRLPTEAEREYAARAGSTADFTYGYDVRQLGNYAWFRDNAGEKTHPVGQKQANTWGLYDVHGNVAEWVYDWYDENYYSSSPASNPYGPPSGASRMLRGGGWYGSAGVLRLAKRNSGGPPDWFDSWVGFRLARSVAGGLIGNTSATPRPPPSTQDSNTAEALGIAFATIAAGTFQIGSEKGQSDERPVHNATLANGFYMSRHEVTQAQYTALMGTNPSHFKGDDTRPVEGVSWDDAIRFANALSTAEGLTPCYDNDGKVTGGTRGYPFSCEGYRLPTEAEWEYAARAGSTTEYTFGDNANAFILDMSGWYENNAAKTTHPVGQKQPNAWGLYDMHGNVWEWIDGWYTYSNNHMSNPYGFYVNEMRLMRGGSWNNPASTLRSAERNAIPRDHRASDLGFRLVRTMR